VAQARARVETEVVNCDMITTVRMNRTIIIIMKKDKKGSLRVSYVIIVVRRDISREIVLTMKMNSSMARN